jgi:tripartite-type tricarboxylate transporter receptor subunit TctC
MLSFAKANPLKINYGSPGTGSSLHLIAEMLQVSTGMRLLHVPYRGMAPAMTDLLAGHIAMTFDVLGNVLAHVKAGRLKALAVAGESRIPELPDAPAISERVPEFRFRSWFAVVAPPKTQSDITAKVSQAIVETLHLPDVAQKFRELSVTPVGTSPMATASFLKEESERWRQVVAATGVKVE